MLVISFSLLYGTYNSFAAVVSSLTFPFGYSPADNGMFGAVFICSGVLGTVIIGKVIDKTEKYKIATIGISLLAAISLASILWTLPLRNPLYFGINLAFMGFAMIPIFPCGMAFATELTYPIPEAISNGIMLQFSVVLGAILVIIFKYH